ncbi:alpha/beta hydrolase [Amorphus sp. 3PC139-8]|uniref:alpha/beta hydrolase n=1 Tax=Amorphus sp. 3PC139-8 TaxID=2735676 RepID=UPI00345D007C
MSDEIYPGYTQAELDRAYTQKEWAANMDAILKRWSASAPEAKAGHSGYAAFSYGPHPDERIDVFPADGSLIHFHVHGGAWRGQAKEDSAFLAPSMAAAGVTLVLPEFSKLPGVRMPILLEQLKRALAWTHQRFVAEGDATGIVISGHSSGAHLAALLVAENGAEELVPAEALRALVCISGSYDLEPVMLSLRRSYIDLSPDEITALSPIHRIADMRLAAHLFYGADESPEFRRQACAFATALEPAGKLAGCTEIANVNHFEILDVLADPSSEIGRHVHAILATSQISTDVSFRAARGADATLGANGS